MTKALSKAARLAKGMAMVWGVALTLALVLGLSSVALAGTGVGATFNLGQTNTVNAISTLIGSAAGPSLQIDNNSTGTGATALDLQVEAGKAPMKVNSGVKVANLNADNLDDREASSFANGVSGKATDADKLDGKNSSDFVPTELYVEKETFIVPSRAEGVFSAFCDQGDVAISGGYRIIRAESLILQDRPDAFEERWLVHLRTGALSESLDVHVRCADSPPLRP